MFVDDPAALAPLGALLASRAAGDGRIALFVETGGDRRVEIELPRAYALSPTLGGEIGALAGISAVRELPAVGGG